MDQEIRLPAFRLPPYQVNEPRPISTRPIFCSSAYMSRYSALPAFANCSTCSWAATLCFRLRAFIGITSKVLSLLLKPRTADVDH